MNKEESQELNVQRPSVTVIIVTFQSRETIGATLVALVYANNKGIAAVIVVDNASTDGTADYVATEFPWVTLVRNHRNIGFGRGCNLGFDYVDTPYVLLLNPDAKIEFEAIRTLLDFMNKNQKAGICGPAVREESGMLQHAGGTPTPWIIIAQPLFPKCATRGKRSIVPGEEPEATDWICGAAMLLRWKMIERIGQFDPSFFLYFEETDLCYRARKHGWEIWSVGTAVAEHISGASAKQTDSHMTAGNIAEHFYKSRFYYLSKHYGKFVAGVTEIFEILSMALRAMIDVVRNREYLGLRRRLKAPIMKMPAISE